jgi:hypothetical protein
MTTRPDDHVRKIHRRSGHETYCEIFRGDEGPSMSTFLLCYDPTKDDLFIAARRMGAWMEVDMYEVHSRLMGN